MTLPVGRHGVVRFAQTESLRVLPPPSAVPSKRTILVADDEAHLVEVIRATLTSEGYRVVVARDGDDAWNRIRTDRPDAAILDVKMPGRDGVAILGAVRADPTLARMPVVLLTAEDDDAQIWRGWQAGAASYITKPFNFDVLLEHLKTALDT